MPKKLVRDRNNSPQHEMSFVTDMNELNELYYLKVLEELNEIKMSDYKDPNEFGDLLQVVKNWAMINNINMSDLAKAISEKEDKKGVFHNTVLNNLDPNNPSNKLYFDLEKERNNVNN